MEGEEAAVTGGGYLIGYVWVGGSSDSVYMGGRSPDSVCMGGGSPDRTWSYEPNPIHSPFLHSYALGLSKFLLLLQEYKT